MVFSFFPRSFNGTFLGYFCKQKMGCPLKIFFCVMRIFSKLFCMSFWGTFLRGLLDMSF